MVLGKVVVAGGTGFIGSRLVKTLVDQGSLVTVLTRSKSSAGHLPGAVQFAEWNPERVDIENLKDSLRRADLVVNLCGTPVVTRWNESGKRNIIQSRVKPTEAIVSAITALPELERPKCLVNPSAVGYYGISQSASFTEDSSPAKNDFLAEVCVQWERAVESLESVPGTRLVILRIGVVMGVGGGALALMLPAFKLSLGGPVGKGTQWVSWIHVDDVVNMCITAGERSDVSGVYNATAPNPVTMRELSASLSRALKRPNFIPVPEAVLKLAYGSASVVVLEGQKVVPDHWQSDGLQYKYSSIDAAMEAIAKEA